MTFNTFIVVIKLVARDISNVRNEDCLIKNRCANSNSRFFSTSFSGIEEQLKLTRISDSCMFAADLVMPQPSYRIDPAEACTFLRVFFELHKVL